MNIFKRLINVIALCWLLFSSYVTFVVCEAYIKSQPQPKPDDYVWSELRSSENRIHIDNSFPFEDLAIIFYGAAFIFTINYIFFKKMTLWHRTK